MTYTALAATAVLVALAVDLLVTRSRVTTTRTWWVAYAIIVPFQLLTNGWLTGRGIVRYDGDRIIGTGEPTLVGDGRLVFAPVEDLGFGFALVLLTVTVWVRLGRGSTSASPMGSAADRGDRG